MFSQLFSHLGFRPKQRRPKRRRKASPLSLWLIGALGLILAGCDTFNPLSDDLSDARQAVRHGDLLNAEKYLERYLRTAQNPDLRWEAWSLLLSILEREGEDPAWLLESLESMLVEYESHPERRAFVLLRLGKIHERAGRLNRALTFWSQLDAQFDAQPAAPPSDPEASSGDGGKPSEEKSASNNPEKTASTPPASGPKPIARSPFSDMDAAVDLEDRSQAVALKRRLAALHFRLRRFDDAKKCLESCLALPASPELRAYCLCDLSDQASWREHYAEAEKYASQVLSLDDVPPVLKTRATFILADALEQRGDRSGAIKAFTSILKDYPNPAVVESRLRSLEK